MKVRTTKLVNLRHRQPHSSAPIKGTINPGFEIEVQPTDGESIEGNNKWYEDKMVIFSGVVERAI